MITIISRTLRFSLRRFATGLIESMGRVRIGKRKRDEHRNPIRRETVERDALYIAQFCTWLEMWKSDCEPNNSFKVSGRHGIRHETDNHTFLKTQKLIPLWTRKMRSSHFYVVLNCFSPMMVIRYTIQKKLLFILLLVI